MARIMISGYYGFGNIGDEAVLASLIDYIKCTKPEHRIVVLSKDPSLTAELYGVEAVERTSLREIVRTLKKCDLLISGGGSLLQDVTGLGSIPYYLGIINLAIRYGVKVSIFAQGVGPIKREFFRKRVKKTFNRVDNITLRDIDSINLIKAIGVKHEATLTADPAIVLTHFKEEKSSLVEVNSNTILFCIRDWIGCTDFELNIASCIDKIYEKYGMKSMILAFHPEYDTNIALRISNATKCNAEILMNTSKDPKVVKGIIKEAGIVVGMRLHSLIFAASLRVPFIGISYDPKVKSFCESFQQPSIEVLEINDCSSVNPIYDALEDLIQRKDDVIQKLDDVLPRMEELAMVAFEEVLKPIRNLDEVESHNEYCDIFGLNVCTLGIEEVYRCVTTRLEAGEGTRIVTINPEMAGLAKKHPPFRECIENADMIVADGIGIVIASKILGSPTSGRVPGIDLSAKFLEYAAANNKRVYFLGGADTVIESAATAVKEKYGVNIVGFHHGYFRDEAPIIDEIIAKRPDFILVGMGMKLQEDFINRNKSKLDSAVWIGVGGTFDVLSGNVKRAPKAFQKLGLEWFYRLITQPSRFVRMLSIPVFMVNVLFYRFKSKARRGSDV